MLITTIGGSASNSYATIEEIDAYLATTGYDLTAYAAIGSARKVRLAKIACKILDSFSTIGSSADDANSDNWEADHVPQALKFPRDEDSQPIYGSDTIPTEVKEAQAELVYFAANDYAQSDPNALKVGELTVRGDFTAKYTAGGGMMSPYGAPARSVILFMLKPYIKRGALV
jgi:hypothetical protein